MATEPGLDVVDPATATAGRAVASHLARMHRQRTDLFEALDGVPDERGLPESERPYAPDGQEEGDMDPEIRAYNQAQEPNHQEVCDLLAEEIDRHLPEAESKIWHAHPVWFLDGNPTVGYSKQKPGIRLMFWSGADFGEAGLNVVGKKFKDASAFFNSVAEVNQAEVRRWLGKAREIQWDYRNLAKRKGRLERLK